MKERSDGVVIRFASPRDKDQIYAFALTAIARADFPEFAEDAGDGLQERIETGNPEDVLVAEDTTQQNKIIGYIELDPTRSSEDRVVQIRGIYVLPEYRRRGIGKEMLQIVRQKAIDKDIELRINAFTVEGLKFWENLGFQIHHYSLSHKE